MNKAKIEIGDRMFELKIEYDCFEDEEVLPIQEAAVRKFKSVPIEVLEEVKKFCMDNNSDKLNGENVFDIFRYVMPVSLYIKRDTEKRIVAVMCDYTFDMEHGLALIFENEEFKRIGTQSSVL